MTSTRRFVALFVLLSSGAFSFASEKFTAVVLRPLPAPGVRHTTGLTTYDEALRSGRFVARYWNTNGIILPEKYFGPGSGFQNWPPDWPIDSFGLQMEGQDLAGTWKWEGATQAATKSGATESVITLQSQTRPIEVKVHTRIDGSPIFVRWLEITNKGDRPTAISAVYPLSGMLWSRLNYDESVSSGNAVFSVGYNHSFEPLREGDFRWDDLRPGSTVVRSRTGKSGWSLPAFIARNNATGQMLLAELGWSANWTMEFTVQQNALGKTAQFFFRIGPFAADPALRVLDPGETVHTAAVHIGLFDAGLDALVQALHSHVRSIMRTPISGKNSRIQANQRGNLADSEHTEAAVKRQVDLAVAIGAEMFTVDAGWYGPEPNNWPVNVGDWYSGAWLPNGLEAVREYARQKGLLFGVWMEPESIGSASRLLKEHPDWVAQRNGKTISRQLDFSRPEVAAWVEEQIVSVIKRFSPTMFRIDYNTSPGEGGNRAYKGFVENTLWRHVEALYAILERVQKRFPDVLFENCASGGGRQDLGILRYFHQIDPSDMDSLPRAAKILNGLTLFRPPEIMRRQIGFRNFGGSTENIDDLLTQLRIGIMTLPIVRGFAQTPAELNLLLVARTRQYFDLYKQVIRPMLPTSRVYHHTPVLPQSEASSWCVLEYASQDSATGLALLLRLSREGDSEYWFRPRGIDPARKYKVTLGNSGRAFEAPGHDLLQRGIPVQLEAGPASEFLLLEAR